MCKKVVLNFRVRIGLEVLHHLKQWMVKCAGRIVALRLVILALNCLDAREVLNLDIFDNALDGNNGIISRFQQFRERLIELV